MCRAAEQGHQGVALQLVAGGADVEAGKSKGRSNIRRFLAAATLTPANGGAAAVASTYTGSTSPEAVLLNPIPWPPFRLCPRS